MGMIAFLGAPAMRDVALLTASKHSLCISVIQSTADIMSSGLYNAEDTLFIYLQEIILSSSPRDNEL